jgi:NADPH-dependent curcumin reductase CurA
VQTFSQTPLFPKPNQTKPKQNKTKQNKTKQNKTKQSQTAANPFPLQNNTNNKTRQNTTKTRPRIKMQGFIVGTLAKGMEEEFLTEMGALVADGQVGFGFWGEGRSGGLRAACVGLKAWG